MKKISELHANICQVFANPVRIEIVEALIEREHTTKELAEIIGASAVNISQHISLMRNRNMVVSTRSGHFVYHRLTADEIRQVFSIVRGFLISTLEKSGRLAQELR
ncbi:MAG: metalloregulator ArsR/SmtB family transcription factor [Candidatus Lernaella stagnicola]|nr:metalloregulator ArsR/SmtB family transcription factor [Candidatus Lernaella stagnicola]